MSSFSVTLDSENQAGIEGLNTHLGLREQAEGDADVGNTNETGFAIGANYTFPVTDNVEATVLGEWVDISNLDGGADDINYLTTSLGLTLYDNWNVGLSYTNRDRDVSGAAQHTDDHLLQVSAGYAFDNGFTVDAGYRSTVESGVDTHILGALVAYTYEF